MPTTPAVPCSTPRCPKRAEPNQWGLSKCAEHAAQQASHYRSTDTRSPERRRADKAMYGRRWPAMRRAVLARWPHCNRCGAKATDVDHIVPLRRGGANEYANLQPLCRPCHTRKTNTERRAL